MNTSSLSVLANVLLCGALCLDGVAQTTAEFTPAIAAADLDVANCIATTGGVAGKPAPRESLEALLGLRADASAVWLAGANADTVRHFRVAFKQPLAIGTICTTHAGMDSVYWFGVMLERTVSLLKPDAPYPGDVTNEAQWVTLPDGQIKTLPVGTLTRAVRFTERFPSPVATPSPDYTTPVSAMGLALLFKERYFQATKLGSEKEEYAGKAAANLTAFWGEPQDIAGFVVFTLRAVDASAAFLDPKSVAHATVAAPAAWKPAVHATAATFPQAYGFAAPVRTRGIRVIPAKPVGSIAYAFGGPVAILARLEGDEQPPVFSIPPPPFTFELNMPYAGSVGLQILDKQSGRLVTRLLGEATRPQGALREPWNLMDDAGQYVAPGEYTWTALTCPPLELTYETTVNHAGQPPWWAPVRGGGAWMADHSPPLCVGALGDSVVLLGSAVCEKGQAAIAVDLDGRKQWGESPVLVGWGGAYRIASDGTYGYLINHYGIQRVDPRQANYAPTEVHRFDFTPEAPGGAWGGTDLGGAAARGDRLYIAHRAPPAPWIAPAVREGDLDLKRFWPPVTPKARTSEGDYDGTERFFSTFLLMKPHDRTISGFGGEGNAAGRAQEMIIAFTNSMVIGSVLVPDSGARVYALKAGRQLPNNRSEAPEALPGEGSAAEEGVWEQLRAVGAEENAEDEAVDELLTEAFPTFAGTGRPGLTLAKPGGLHTEALRIVAPPLSYCLIMSHRLRDVAPEARRVLGEGRSTAGGGWWVERPAKPLITQENPARLALVWDRDMDLHGVTLHLPNTASMRIDCWTGPSTNDPSAFLADDRFWEQRGSVDIAIDRYWPRNSGIRAVDFGGAVHTRALRIRAVLAAGVLGVQGFKSAVVGTQEAGFDAILAYSAAGDDAPDVPVCRNERITEYRLPAGATGSVAVVRHIALTKPGYMAFGKDGTLFAVSDGRVVAVPLEGPGEPREVIGREQLEKPAGVAMDADGRLYVVDQGPSVVKVFDVANGALVRTIGTPGGMRLGLWDPTRFDTPLDVAVDGRGKLWVVENNLQPKRVSRWTRDGVLEKSFLGPASYGGGGAYGGAAWMDPADRRFVNFDGMKFEIDWKDGSSRLASILYRPGVNSPDRSAAPNRVLYFEGRRYLLGDPRVYREIAVICEERNGVAVPMAAAGNLGFWENLTQYPGFKEALADISREGYGFVWTDESGDGIPQVAEVKWTDKNRLGPLYCATCIGEDLSFTFAGTRLRPVGFTPQGAPRYDLDKLESVPLLGGHSSWTTADGYTFVVGGNWLVGPDGSKLWQIPDEHPGVNQSGAPRQIGKPIAQFEAMGHLTFGKEELFISNGNYGDWFVTSRDGLMPAWVLGGPPGHGLRHWTMPEWACGKTRLDDLRMDAEDFCGSIVQADDGHVYLSAGGQQNSIVRVDGFEKMVRLNGVCTVTPDDLAAARTWQARVAALRRAVETPKIARLSRAAEYNVVIDGGLDEWVAVPFLPIRDVAVEGKGRVVVEEAALACDEERLLVAARGTGPMRNGAAESRTLFRGGDALDVCLGLDPQAEIGRAQPVAGDLRLVFARPKAGPTLAALYRPATAATPDGRRQRYYSPAGGEVVLDVVAPVPDAKIMVQGGEGWWTLEASIPWKSLGADAPESGTRLRGDVGVLHGDQNSLHAVERFYWAGKSQTCVSDEPTEARLTPALWGDFMVERDAHAQNLVTPPDALGSGGGTASPGLDLDLDP